MILLVMVIFILMVPISLIGIPVVAGMKKQRNTIRAQVQKLLYSGDIPRVPMVMFY